MIQDFKFALWQFLKAPGLRIARDELVDSCFPRSIPILEISVIRG